jgi:S-formylglutathione hydrolase
MHYSVLRIIDTNFAQKAGPQAFPAAEKEGIAIILPDTSPRDNDMDGNAIPNVVDRYDLGIGASFYVNADQDPYSKHYLMYTYITHELPRFLEEQFGFGKDGLRSIAGHSMGGHGALMIALNNPSAWVSVSAFAPICNRKYNIFFSKVCNCFAPP